MGRIHRWSQTMHSKMLEPHQIEFEETLPQEVIEWVESNKKKDTNMVLIIGLVITSLGMLAISAYLLFK